MGGFPLELRAESKQPEATHLKDEIKEINEHVLLVSFSVGSVRFQNHFFFSENSAEISTATRLKSTEYHQAGYFLGAHRNIGTSQR